jgi:hypothetical protein
MKLTGLLRIFCRRTLSFAGELDEWERQKYQATVEGIERADRIRRSALHRPASEPHSEAADLSTAVEMPSEAAFSISTCEANSLRAAR